MNATSYLSVQMIGIILQQLPISFFSAFDISSIQSISFNPFSLLHSIEISPSHLEHSITNHSPNQLSMNKHSDSLLSPSFPIVIKYLGRRMKQSLLCRLIYTRLDSSICYILIKTGHYKYHSPTTANKDAGIAA